MCVSLLVELKADNEKLKGDAESWAVAFYRKQDEAEKLADSLQVHACELERQLRIRKGADADLVACLQRVQDLGPQLVSV